MGKSAHALGSMYGSTSTAAASGDELVLLAERSRQPFDPEVTLFADETPESQEAQRLPESAGEEFRTLRATGDRIPSAVFALAAFDGVTGVRELIRELGSFDQAVATAYDRHIDHGRRTARARADSCRDQKHDEYAIPRRDIE